MAKIIDVFTYNGEMKMLQLHLNILGDYVDKFVIVEANKTFTGLDKPLYFFTQQRFFKKWWAKIEYYPITEWDNVELWEQAIKSPNTKGANHWKREWFIKEHIHFALQKAGAQPDDLLFIGDVDEIVDPMVQFESKNPVKAKLRVYAYWLNNRSNEEFWGTLITQYKDIQGKCLNHMRSDKALYSKGDYLGWHFTSMGGIDEVRRKLNSSYTPETYNTYDVQYNLPKRLEAGQDYLGRDFQFKIDESEWPPFLVKHKKDYDSLCK